MPQSFGQLLGSCVSPDHRHLRYLSSDSDLLRPMCEADIAQAISLISQTMNPTEAGYAAQTLQFHFSCRFHGIEDGRSYFVLARGSETLGLAGLHHSLWGPAENVWLTWFAIDPLFQGRGFGSALLQSMMHEARERGFMKLFIETYSTPEFARARDLYSAAGFTCAGMIASYLPSGGDMLAFYKSLTPQYDRAD